MKELIKLIPDLNTPLTAALGGIALFLGIIRFVVLKFADEKLFSKLDKKGTLSIVKTILTYIFIALVLFLVLVLGRGFFEYRDTVNINNNPDQHCVSN